MFPIEVSYSEKPATYDGRHLRPRFAQSTYGVRGSSLVLWKGACEVPTDHMVDLEDRQAENFIRAKEMLHIIGELFDVTLTQGILVQHLCLGWIMDTLRDLSPSPLTLTRRGNDVYWGNDQDRRKLTVSIATAAPGSVLFHVGLNIDATGAPVAAAGLADLQISESNFIENLIQLMRADCVHFHRSLSKSLPLV